MWAPPVRHPLLRVIVVNSLIDFSPKVFVLSDEVFVAVAGLYLGFVFLVGLEKWVLLA